jgi:hypothetical protein
MGGFTLEVDKADLDFAADQLGSVRDLVVKLKEKPRGTSNFFQLTGEATLTVDVDVNSLILGFNPSGSGSGDNADDDAYELRGSAIRFGYAEKNLHADGANAAAQTAHFNLDLAGALSKVTDNVAVHHQHSVWNNGTGILKSKAFPVGGVVVGLANVTDGTRTVTLKSGGADYTFEVQNNTQFGMTLYGSIEYNNAPARGSLTIATNFEPIDGQGIAEHGVLGAGANHKTSITVMINNAENFNKVQQIFVSRDVDGNGQIETGAGQGDESSGTGNLGAAVPTDGLDPATNDPDVFSLTLDLAGLAQDTAGGLGRLMRTEVENQLNASPLLKKWQITLDAITFDPVSDLSKFMRNLVQTDLDGPNSGGRTFPAPLKAGDTLIVKTPAALNLEVSPFAYSFNPTSNNAADSSEVTEFKMLNAINVFAVLKQAAAGADVYEHSVVNGASVLGNKRTA